MRLKSPIVTDGATLVAVRYITPLVYSTYKANCLDRGTCPFLDACCEGPTRTGFVNHLIVSSERLQGDNTWIDLENHEVIGVDWRMALHRGVIRPDGSVQLQANYQQTDVNAA